MLFSTLLRSLLLLILTVVILADSTTSSAISQTTESQPTSTPSIAYGYDQDPNYTFQGCFNETTMLNVTGNKRALSGGQVRSTEDMTVPLCLFDCWTSGYTYAGLEYSKECYCAQDLSTYSELLPMTACNLPCAANQTQICGGHLTLSVYNTTKRTNKPGSAGAKTNASPVSSLLAFGIAMGVLLCMV